jgi:stage II sporulation protein D
LVGELPSDWPKEAVKAQAVAARSYTLFQVLLKDNEPYHLESNVLDQVFSLNQTSESLKKVKVALKETEGLILLQEYQLLKSYYHADCGGQTEEAENVWGVKEINSGTTQDAYCLRHSKKWQYKVSKKDFFKKISQSSDDLSFVERMGDLVRTASNRVLYITLYGSSSFLQWGRVTGQEIRQIFGFDKIKSALFNIKEQGEDFIFIGRGFGHGSGLCQWGSRSLALEGRTSLEILNHYYPKAKVTKLDQNKRLEFSISKLSRRHQSEATW